MTWPSSAATLAFSGAASVTVVLDGRLEALPSPDREYSELFRVGVFPTCAFQVGQPREASGCAAAGGRAGSCSGHVLLLAASHPVGVAWRIALQFQIVFMID